MNEAVKRTAWWELGLLYAAFLIINVACALWQRPITYQHGMGWEGVGYHAVAKCFVEGVRPAAEGPYVYRLGTPWLAAKVAPGDLFLGFKLVNLLANACGVALLWLWLRRHLTVPWVRVALVLTYLAEWDAPTRWIWFYPIHTDPWLYVWLFGGLLLVDHYRETRSATVFAALCVLSVLAVINREVAMLVPLALLAIDRPLVAGWEVKWPTWWLAIPMAMSLIVFVVIKRLVQQTDGYSFLGTVLDFIYTKGVAGYLQGWCLAFGPILLVAVYDWRRAGRFLAERQDLLLYALACAFFGYAGGTDTERLLFWGMPVVYVLIGKGLEANAALFQRPSMLALLIAGQILTTRILWPTPDYPNETRHSFPILQQVGANVPFLDLFSYHGFRVKEFLGLVQWVFYIAGFFALASYLRRESSKSAEAASPPKV